ncbi:MAG: type III pantothenate kinase [Phycisphaerales bacterium]
MSLEKTTGPNLVAVSVGNTRITVARVESGRIESSDRFALDDLDSAVARVRDHWSAVEDLEAASILIASVNREVYAPLLARLKQQAPSNRIFRVGVDLPIPIGRQLDEDATPGDDRLLNAAAAFDKLQQACVIIDAGSAVTVDFVDGQGTFHGGAILPGARMQLKAMHEGTSQLPSLSFEPPEPDWFAPNTRQSMLHGVYYGIRGAVRFLIERYAEGYQAYPRIIATGGDAHTLFDDDELIETIVDDLTIFGIAATARVALTADHES